MAYSPSSSHSSDTDINMSDFPQPPSTRNPILTTAPPGKPPTHLQPTPFSPAYRSPFILSKSHAHLLPLLRHLNCSYLSTPGLAPSLLHLKQHAQSLAVLIKAITISTQASTIPPSNPLDADGEVDIDDLEARDGESWDWLNDLTGPYSGPEREGLHYHHTLPLTALLNVLDSSPSSPSHSPDEEVNPNIHTHCPLYSATRSPHLPHNGTALPYATHQSLITHANAVLELLDHEYSARGGLLAILPPQSEKEDRANAESTILGQYILYTQRLVARLHELEREYANACDVLKGEAKVPAQTLSKLGAEGRKGREIVYPQDRFVLVNAGEDVLAFLERELSDKERTDEIVKENHLRQGLMGEQLWAKSSSGKDESKGIIAVDVVTRYFKLRGGRNTGGEAGLGTIFIIPAHQRHPGVKTTVEIEKQPTVVSVVKPIWPERQSLWEQKQRAQLSQLAATQRENEELRQKIEWAEEAQKALVFDNALKDGEVRALRREMGELRAVVEKKGGDEEVKRVYRDYNELVALRGTVEKEIALAERVKTEAKVVRDGAERVRREVEEANEQLLRYRHERDEERERRYLEAMERVERMDREAAVNAVELERKLKEVLGGQVSELQVFLAWARGRVLGMDEVEGDIIARGVVERGRKMGGEIVERVVGGIGGRNTFGDSAEPGRRLGTEEEEEEEGEEEEGEEDWEVENVTPTPEGKKIPITPVSDPKGQKWTQVEDVSGEE